MSSGVLSTDRLAVSNRCAEERMQALYEMHGARLLRFLVALTQGDQPAAEDLLQETLIRAWRHLDRLTAEPEDLGPWLFTVARRVAIDARRARRIRPAATGAVDVDGLGGPDRRIEAVVRNSVIRQALSELTPEHRAVLLEIYCRGRSVRETSAELGIPPGTVKSRTYHAVRALRRLIGDLDDWA